jgi:hypothetical protein
MASIKRGVGVAFKIYYITAWRRKTRPAAIDADPRRARMVPGDRHQFLLN